MRNVATRPRITDSGKRDESGTPRRTWTTTSKRTQNASENGRVLRQSSQNYSTKELKQSLKAAELKLERATDSESAPTYAQQVEELTDEIDRRSNPELKKAMRSVQAELQKAVDELKARMKDKEHSRRTLGAFRPLHVIGRARISLLVREAQGHCLGYGLIVPLPRRDDPASHISTKILSFLKSLPHLALRRRPFWPLRPIRGARPSKCGHSGIKRPGHKDSPQDAKEIRFCARLWAFYECAPGRADGLQSRHTGFDSSRSCLIGLIYRRTEGRSSNGKILRDRGSTPRRSNELKTGRSERNQWEK